MSTDYVVWRKKGSDRKIDGRSDSFPVNEIIAATEMDEGSEFNFRFCSLSTGQVGMF
jgi:hypothetical protein